DRIMNPPRPAQPASGSRPTATPTPVARPVPPAQPVADAIPVVDLIPEVQRVLEAEPAPVAKVREGPVGPQAPASRAREVPVQARAAKARAAEEPKPSACAGGCLVVLLLGALTAGGVWVGYKFFGLDKAVDRALAAIKGMGKGGTTETAQPITA